MNLKEAATQLGVSYRQCFGSPAGQIVLEDLQAICHAIEGPYAGGPHDDTMVRLGRNMVWLHIARHIGLTPEQLFALYSGRRIDIPSPSDGDKR